jgi:hypothetical protein
MPGGLSSILAALAGGAGAYSDLMGAKEREAIRARAEARQRQMDAMSFALDKARLVESGAERVDPTQIGQQQSALRSAMDFTKESMGSQPSMQTPDLGLPPVTTESGLTLASPELPSQYNPQAIARSVVGQDQGKLSALDAIKNTSVPFDFGQGQEFYRIPTTAEKQAKSEAKTRKDLIEEGQGIGRQLGFENVSDADAISYAKNPNLADIRGRETKVTKENAYIVDLAKRAKGKGPDAEQARLELLIKAPSAHAALFPTAPRGTTASELRDNLLAATATFRRGHANPLTGELVVPTEDQVAEFAAGLLRDMGAFTAAAGRGYVPSPATAPRTPTPSATPQGQKRSITTDQKDYLKAQGMTDAQINAQYTVKGRP